MAKQTVKSNSIFEVTQDFLDATESQQDTAVKAFMSANPNAMTVPKSDGAIPPYLRRQSGKRFDINIAFTSGEMSARDGVRMATALGGGIRDVAALLSGGYSRTSKFYGTSFITLSA